jgi:ATP-dependent DNA helicase RecQ
VCNGAVRLVDGTLEARKALSAVARTKGRFYIGHLVNILAGKKTEAVERFAHDKLQTFGVGADRPSSAWSGVFRQLLSANMIVRDRQDGDRLMLTDAGFKLMKGELPFHLREEVLAAKAKGGRKTVPIPRDADSDLLAALKALRAAMAKAANQPAYVIFPDRTLIEMARLRPRTLDELGAVHGVGAAKLQKYGAAFLAVIKDHKSA